MHHASLLSSNGHHFTFTSKIISSQINVFIVPGGRSRAARAPPSGDRGNALPSLMWAQGLMTGRRVGGQGERSGVQVRERAWTP